VRRDGDQGAVDEATSGAEGSAEVAEPGLTDRLKESISRAVGVDELIGQMRDAAAELARPASYVGQNVPRNTGQQM
jgi:hypothetical protein